MAEAVLQLQASPLILTLRAEQAALQRAQLQQYDEISLATAGYEQQ